MQIVLEYTIRILKKLPKNGMIQTRHKKGVGSPEPGSY
jgi:hypothetical protein